jgi:hypothetical protein
MEAIFAIITIVGASVALAVSARAWDVVSRESEPDELDILRLERSL